ncbi:MULTISPECIES: sensor histidine kinase [Paenibacillus]|jgi:signal transduction histidine kinase|uniref:histidine kinase n=1 Tax=Paenibacillus barengoltzii J12 TaxID=935846 RepID=A0ABY1LXT1_9BACL|nr:MULTISPECIES: HAMP domain-containing sensor histidine kinase [Paenibacillus]MEC2344502.1 HAMP domain-containing sensor histidine kinase [Paenibacillus barengoltzii]SMF28214.1 Signal transduction histidine kinase [Paenibacillus barengoltzii J12]SMF29000.1 Signal transduction histidine kinase [Paenibacillus barengoltzii]
MTIRLRLILSYIAMVLIPILLTMVMAMVLTRVFFGAGDSADSEKGSFQFHGHALSEFWAKISEREERMNGVKFVAEQAPELLADLKFLTKTGDTLQDLQAGFVVVRNGQVAFASSNVEQEGLEEELARISAEQGESHAKWMKRMHREPKVAGRYTAERVDFTFADGSAGTLYLLSDLSPLLGKMSRFMPLMFLILLLIIGLTNLLLTFFVSRSILRPLYTLKRAAERIKEGDLDHPLQMQRTDEFGEVGEAFEEMRERLKHSIQLQLQYEENRKEMLSNISHDLKTPITGIKACVEGLRDRVADTEEKRDKYISMIGQKADDMDRMIEELFLFSKLDLKRLPFDFEPVDLYNFLQSCSEELKADPRFAEVNVEFVASAEPPLYVTADRDKLKRVLMNIADNSLHYMNKPDKRLTLELESNPSEALVRFRDNGDGINEGALPKVFERFYRAEASRSSQNGRSGSGLGLAIVRQIIEAHGGMVRADSQLGVGTTISFSLPRHVPGLPRKGGEMK